MKNCYTRREPTHKRRHGNQAAVCRVQRDQAIDVMLEVDHTYCCHALLWLRSDIFVGLTDVILQIWNISEERASGSVSNKEGNLSKLKQTK